MDSRILVFSQSYILCEFSHYFEAGILFGNLSRQEFFDISRFPFRILAISTAWKRDPRKIGAG